MPIFSLILEDWGINGEAEIPPKQDGAIGKVGESKSAGCSVEDDPKDSILSRGKLSRRSPESWLSQLELERKSCCCCFCCGC